jgi:Na+-transporting NADH:ubiquinone oxidoreductase subunit C
MNTIYGVTFDHKGETPGLGAEINTTIFESQFRGKKIFDNDTFVSIGVIKGGTKPENLHGVDAISGGTITSKGLEKMLFDCISKYNDFLLKNRH